MKKSMLFLLTVFLFCGNLEASTCQCSAKDLSRAFTDVAREATPAVVFIKVENIPEYGNHQGNDQFDLFNDEFFNRFFGGAPRNRRQPPPPQLSQGSGFIISSDGYVITNYHVVKDAKTITISLQNGMQRELPATLIGGDPHTDVALVKIDDSENGDFPYLEFGNSDEMEVGEWVIAIGNPFQLEASVTVGVISAKGRQNLQITDLEDFIQTDAAINPGNSGGPLLSLDGKVIGINTAIASRSGGYMGIGFAVPSMIAENIKNQLMQKGAVTRGFLGVSMQPIDKELAEAFKLKNTEGALVAEVVKDSPADKAGLKQGDIITKINGTKVKSPSSLRNKVLLLEPGTKITLTVNRDGKMKKVDVTLGSHSQMSGATAPMAQDIGFTVDNLSQENISKYRLNPEDQGVVITDVKAGSMAAKMGLRSGFLILAVNHQKVVDVTEFNKVIKEVGSGQRVLLLVKQGDVMRFHSFKAP